MADTTLLDSFPAPVRVFVRAAQSAGMEYREGHQTTLTGEAMASLHGDVAVFGALTGMESCRIPVKRGHWWLALGIVGTIERSGDEVAAVIDYNRHTSARTRARAAERAPADAAFGAFMGQLIAAPAA